MPTSLEEQYQAYLRKERERIMEDAKRKFQRFQDMMDAVTRFVTYIPRRMIEWVGETPPPPRA